MGAYRCSICNINFKHFYGGKCPTCTQALWYDKDSTATVDETQDVQGEAQPDYDNLLVPNVDQPVTSYNGVDWIPHDDLIEAGYTNLEPFNVVRIRNRFYELQARVGRSLTHGIKGGAWWIEEILPLYEIEQLFVDPEIPFFRVMSYDDYDKLERSRGAEPL